MLLSDKHRCACIVQLTSKIWPINMHQVEKALDETLEKLGTDYLDREYPKCSPAYTHPRAHGTRRQSTSSTGPCT